MRPYHDERLAFFKKVVREEPVSLARLLDNVERLNLLASVRLMGAKVDDLQELFSDPLSELANAQEEGSP